MTTHATHRTADHPLPSPAAAKALPFAAVVHYDESGTRYLSAMSPDDAAKHLGEQEQHGRRLWFAFSTLLVMAAIALGYLLQFFQDHQQSHLLAALVLSVPAAAFSLQMRRLLKTVPGAQRIATAPCPFPVPDRVVEKPHQAMDAIEQLQWADSADDLADMHRDLAKQLLGAG